MPSCPRSEIFESGVVGIYHCYNRTARHAWICGRDPVSETDYEHRREWITEREALLVRLYAVEVCWHAEMSNHIHLILRNRPDVVETWSDREVVRRILIINQLTRRFDNSYDEPEEAEIQQKLGDPEKVAEYRQRLSHISCFMASLDEYISRRANFEDGVTGTFWAGRYKCRRLHDEAGILVCGIYVDLNQIRAGEAATPEESTHTSAYDRIRGREQRRQKGDGSDRGPRADRWLCELPLREGPDSDPQAGLASRTPDRLTDRGLLPMTLEDYLRLLDWTGRQKVAGKSGAIPADLAPILDRLHISQDAWLETVTNFHDIFGRAVGRASTMAAEAARAGRRWIRGQTRCATAFT